MEDYASWNRETSDGIKFKLVEGYPKLSTGEDGTTATERYYLRSEDALDFVLEAIPPPVVTSGGFILLPPRRRMPGTSFLVTKQITLEPLGGLGLPGDYFGADSANPESYASLVVATISYSADIESDEDDRNEEDPETFLERSIDVGGEFLSLGASKTETADVDTGDDITEQTVKKDNPDPQMAVIKTIPTAELSYRWSYVLRPNWATIWRYLGTINTAQQSLFYDFPPECVLFQGITARQKWVWYGGTIRYKPWDIEFKFSARRIDEGGAFYGWNHVWSESEAKWIKVLRAGTLPLYESANHLLLFTARPAS